MENALPGQEEGNGAARPRWIAAWAGARAVLSDALDVLLPPLCLACRKPVRAHRALCPACWAQTDFISAPFCQRLGTPFEVDLGPGIISPRAIAQPPAFARARAVARYDGPARTLVHRLKYGDRLELAHAMGAWMARAGREVLAGADLLVPVPIHARRLMWRRHNQAAELARAVARESGVPAAHTLLRRIKPTRTQVGLSAAERARNLSGAFAVSQEARVVLKGRRVVLIDDVMTTASTLDACARVLRRAGAEEVDALVFALVAQRV